MRRRGCLLVAVPRDRRPGQRRQRRLFRARRVRFVRPSKRRRPRRSRRRSALFTRLRVGGLCAPDVRLGGGLRERALEKASGSGKSGRASPAVSVVVVVVVVFTGRPSRRGLVSVVVSVSGGNDASSAKRFDPATNDASEAESPAPLASRRFLSAPQRSHRARHPELACAHAPQGQSPAQRQLVSAVGARVWLCFPLSAPTAPTAGHSSFGEAESTDASALCLRAPFSSGSLFGSRRASSISPFASATSTAAEPSPSSDADEPPEQEDVVSSEAERGPAGESSGESARTNASVPSMCASAWSSNEVSRPRRARERARSTVASVRCASDGPS